MTNETDQAFANMAYSLGVQAYVWGFPVVISEQSGLIDSDHMAHVRLVKQ